MITPLDIEKKEFARGVRGYKEDEVDEFLNLIIVDLDKLIKENEGLKAENEKLVNEIHSAKTAEAEIVDTLETAKKLMNEISASAEKRADVLLKNAELDADLIRREARETSERLMDDSRSLRTRVSTLREKYRTLLETELERFDTLSAELFLEADDIVKSLPDTLNQPAVTQDTVVVKPVTAEEAEEKAEQEPEKVDMTKTMANIR